MLCIKKEEENLKEEKEINIYKIRRNIPRNIIYFVFMFQKNWIPMSESPWTAVIISMIKIRKG